MRLSAFRFPLCALLCLTLAGSLHSQTAWPTVKFNNSTGSATQASGAGPATAVYGSNSYRNADGTQIAFFEGSAPDLSGVGYTGAHVLYVNTASGIRFAAISGVKDTQQTLTGDTTATSTTVDGCSSTAGLTIGDVVKLVGAGAAGADLYTAVASVTDADTFEIATAAGTTTDDTAITDGKHVTVYTAYTGAATALAWAIGGKRSSPEDAQDRYLFTTDAQDGWQFDIEQTGTDYTFTTRWDWTAAKRIRVFSSSATKPILKRSFSAYSSLIQLNASAVVAHVHNLKLVNYGGTASYAIVYAVSCNKLTLTNCELDADGSSAGSCYGVYLEYNNAVSASLFNCEIRDCAIGLAGTGNNRILADRCFFKSCTKGIQHAYAPGFTLTRCIFSGGTHGLNVLPTSGGSPQYVDKCVFYNNSTAGIYLSPSVYRSLHMTDCIFTGCGYGVSSNASVATYWPSVWKNNCFYGNTNDVETGDGLALDATDLTVDPEFEDAASDDFRLKSTSDLIGAGYHPSYGFGGH